MDVIGFLFLPLGASKAHWDWFGVIVFLLAFVWLIWLVTQFFSNFDTPPGMAWDDVSGVDRVRGKIRITFQSGLQYVGSGTVWRELPDFRSASYGEVDALLRIQRRAEHEGLLSQ